MSDLSIVEVLDGVSVVSAADLVVISEIGRQEMPVDQIFPALLGWRYVAESLAGDTDPMEYVFLLEIRIPFSQGRKSDYGGPDPLEQESSLDLSLPLPFPFEGALFGTCALM